MAGNNNDLRIKIVAKLDETLSTKQLQKQLDNISKKLKLNIGIDQKQLKEISNAIKQIQAQQGQQGKRIKVVDDKEVNKIKEIHSSLDSAVKKYSKMGTVKFDRTLNPVTKELEKFELRVTKANGEVEKLKFQLTSLMGIKGVNGFALYDNKISNNSQAQKEKQLQETQKINRKIEQEEKNSTNKIIQERERLSQGFKKLFDQAKISESTFNKFNKSINSAKNIQELEKIQKKLQLVTNSTNNKALQQKLISDAQTLLRTHSKTVDSSGVNKLITDLNRLRPSALNASNALAQAQIQMRGFQQSARESTRSSMTIMDAFRTAMVNTCRLI